MTVPRIMIVEDENIVAEDIQGAVKYAGYSVSAVVSSGEEAIRNCKSQLIWPSTKTNY